MNHPLAEEVIARRKACEHVKKICRDLHIGTVTYYKILSAFGIRQPKNQLNKTRSDVYHNAH